jgi:hypothetical protein
MSRFIKYSVAASLLIVVGTIGWLGFAGGTNPVYGAVAERLEHLRTITYQMKWSDEAHLMNPVAGDGDRVIHLAPSHDRIERSNGTVLVIDTDAQKAIELNPEAKTALIIDGQAAIDMALLSRGPVRLLETLRKHFRVGETKPAGVEELTLRTIDGIRTQGFRSTIEGEIVEAWIDPATSLPLEIRICLTLPPQFTGSSDRTTRMWRVLSAFEFDAEVPQPLMSVEVPAGYERIEMPKLTNDKPLSKPSLTDLIAALRLCAQHNDSMFPESLSMDDSPGSCVAIMKRFAKSQEQEYKNGTEIEKQAAMKSAMEFGMTIGRITPFLFTLRPENKFRYVGSGLKLDTPDRPILWYVPDGETQYKVVYADLSIKSVAESSLPKLSKPDDLKPQPQSNIQVTSPRVTFPQSAITRYDALQKIRQQGGQDEVLFIDLHLMPEFSENAVSSDTRQGSGTSRFKFLEMFPKLEGLNVEHLVMTENDLAVIGLCRSLKYLSLGGVRIIGTPGGEKRSLQGDHLRHLNQLNSLEMLDLSQSHYSGGLHHLGTLPQLRTLILSSFENSNDSSIAQLKELPHLQTLVLAAVYGVNPEVTVTQAGLSTLKELQSLRTLYVEYHGKRTIPVDTLQSLLPKVAVRRGFQETQSNSTIEALKKLGREMQSR